MDDILTLRRHRFPQRETSTVTRVRKPNRISTTFTQDYSSPHRDTFTLLPALHLYIPTISRLHSSQQTRSARLTTLPPATFVQLKSTKDYAHKLKMRQILIRYQRIVEIDLTNNYKDRYNIQCATNSYPLTTHYQFEPTNIHTHTHNMKAADSYPLAIPLRIGPC